MYKNFSWVVDIIISGYVQKLYDGYEIIQRKE